LPSAGLNVLNRHGRPKTKTFNESDDRVYTKLLTFPPQQARESIPQIKPLRASWDLRRERDTSLEYVVRILAELKERSLIADSPELYGWTTQLREQSLGASVDYTADSKTVGDLSEERLRLLCLIASARAQYARYLVDQLCTAEPVRFLEWQRDVSSND
jgi:hypothetical protein